MAVGIVDLKILHLGIPMLLSFGLCCIGTDNLLHNFRPSTIDVFGFCSNSWSIT